MKRFEMIGIDSNAMKNPAMTRVLDVKKIRPDYLYQTSDACRLLGVSRVEFARKRELWNLHPVNSKTKTHEYLGSEIQRVWKLIDQDSDRTEFANHYWALVLGIHHHDFKDVAQEHGIDRTSDGWITPASMVDFLRKTKATPIIIWSEWYDPDSGDQEEGYRGVWGRMIGGQFEGEKTWDKEVLGFFIPNAMVRRNRIPELRNSTKKPDGHSSIRQELWRNIDPLG